MTNLPGKQVRRGLVRQFLFTLVAFAMLGVSQCLVAATVSLEASLAVYKSSHRASDALIVEFSLTNHGDEPVRVLPWNTPLEGRFTAPIFKVETSDGRIIEYIGPMLKRRAPTAGDYLTLGSGEVVSARLDLAEAYALYDTGSYWISFDADLEILDNPSVGVSAVTRKRHSPAVRGTSRIHNQPCLRLGSGDSERGGLRLE